MPWHDLATDVPSRRPFGAFVSAVFDFMMTEHAAWRPVSSGRQRAFRMPDGGLWLAAVDEQKLALNALAPSATEPVFDIYTATTLDGSLHSRVPSLASALRRLGRVGRFRNSSLWDAIALAIVRQVVRAGQSKKMYRTFSLMYGEPILVPEAPEYRLFPTPETVLSLSAEQFAATGMAFKRRPLMAAAEAFLLYGEKWQELSPEVLIQALQEVPRIGPWTAHAAVADWCNDWSLYPYTDLAVRTWARRAAPSFDWPADEVAFGRAWRMFGGDQLSSLTLLTLAWGSQHGDIG